MNLPAKIYTKADLERARAKGKTVGWIQGAAVVVGAAFVWNLLGWIPTLLVTGAVVYVLYRLLAKPSGKPEPDISELDIDSIDLDDLKL